MQIKYLPMIVGDFKKGTLIRELLLLDIGGTYTIKAQGTLFTEEDEIYFIALCKKIIKKILCHNPELDFDILMSVNSCIIQRVK